MGSDAAWREPGGAGTRERPAGHAPNWPPIAAAGVSWWDWVTKRGHAESGAVLLPPLVLAHAIHPRAQVIGTPLRGT